MKFRKEVTPGLLLFLIIFCSSLVFAQTDSSGCFAEPSFVRVQAGGCSEISFVEAKEWCDDDAACLDTYYYSSVSCSNIEICDFNPSTWCIDECEQVDYQAACFDRASWVNSTSTPDVCQIGCCLCDKDSNVASDNICTASITSVECNNKCSVYTGYYVGFFRTDLDASECPDVCHAYVAEPAKVSGRVSDEDGIPINDVVVKSSGIETTTDFNGFYELVGLPSGSVTFFASKSGYATSSVTIDIEPGEEAELDIVLRKGGDGEIRGIVKNEAGTSINNALVYIEGPTVSQTRSDVNGEFEIEELSFGTYTITVSAEGFGQSVLQTSISQEDPIADLEIVLGLAPLGTVKGKVVDNLGEPVSFAKVLIDSRVKTHTSEAGTYIFELDSSDEGVEYSILVSKAGYEPSQEFKFVITTGETKTYNFVLQSMESECPYPERPKVAELLAGHVPGDKAVMLSWTRPCRDVGAFVVSKINVDTKEESYLTYVPIFDNNFNHEYVDRDVEWGGTYEYLIQAIYVDVEKRKSEVTKSNQISLGDKRCEGKFYGGVFTEFCDGEYMRVTCDFENQIINAPSGTPYPVDCSEWGELFYCMGPNMLRKTMCKDISVCSSGPQDATPFGLYFNKLSCYGKIDVQEGVFVNPCYFDYSTSIVDGCYACNKIKSCFDYEGEDACKVNNCVPNGEECLWVDSVFEVGAGFCAPLGYNGTDHCKDCSAKDGSLFGSTNCTSEICSALGACYPNVDGDSCVACSSEYSKCTNYGDVEACIGNQELNIIEGVVYYSGDQCNLGRCKWGFGSCFKDGDDDGIDECSTFLDEKKRVLCEMDNKASNTRVINEDVVFVNQNDGVVDFYSDGNPKELYYCIDKENICVPSGDESYEIVDGFVSLNLSSDTGLMEEYDVEDTYFIRFFSKDVYFNQESIKSHPIYVDMSDPEFDSFNYTLALDPEGSFLTITFTVREQVMCSDKLVYFDSGGEQSVLNNEIGSSWSVEYDGLEDGLYLYQVECRDNVGNTIVREEYIKVDAIRFIQIEYPPRALKESNFRFVVRTAGQSVCQLYDGDTWKETMVSQEDGRLHLSGFYTFDVNEYYFTWNVQCLHPSGETEREYVPFTIDLLPPETTLVLRTPDGAEKKFSDSTNWHTKIVANSTIHFECDDLPKKGFGCKKHYACVVSDSPDCEPQLVDEEEGLSPITTDVLIRYYSEDGGGNKETERFGRVFVIDDFGIEIVKPSYGVSSVREFDLEISSAVATDTCKWVVGGFDFDFEDIIADRSFFTKITSTRHEIINFTDLIQPLRPNQGFPIAIKCNNSKGKISPVQVFNLIYDPTPPRISALADPALVSEGTSVDIVAKGDDMVICRYDALHKEFESMRYKFPEYDHPIFKKEHKSVLNLKAEDDQKQHTYNVMCMNRAENFSNLATATFRVDFTAPGRIVSTKPVGVVSNENVELGVTTSKAALCEFRRNTSFKYFTMTGGKDHYVMESGFNQGLKRIPVRCTFRDSGAIINGQIKFVVDRTEPYMVDVMVPNVSCSLRRLYPEFIARDNQSSIDGFYYELINAFTGKVVRDGNTSSSRPKITGLNLSLDDEYYFRVSAFDEAGYESEEFESDTFRATKDDLTECLEIGPPKVFVKKSTTCTGVSVTLECRDENGCADLSYDNPIGGDDCNPTNLPYSSSIHFTSKRFLCYRALDKAGKVTEAKYGFINVPDEDGDGVLDHCDKCAGTSPGSSVGADGCSGQAELDSDGDGLPDRWEDQWDNPNGCNFNKYNDNSDGIGGKDGQDNYDGDTFNNLQEYQSNADPCEHIKDDDGDGVVNDKDECENTDPSDEPIDEFGCGYTQKDTDEDGLPDHWEDKYDCVSAAAKDADVDFDKDELTNRQEFTYGTNPCKKDTDGDGASDGAEVKAGTDPTDKDDKPNTVNVFGVILLILGILMLLAGAGILGWYYTQGPGVKKKPKARPPISPFGAQKAPPKRQFVPVRRQQMGPTKEQLLRMQRLKRMKELRKKRMDEMEKKRMALFGAFEDKSKKPVEEKKVEGRKVEGAEKVEGGEVEKVGKVEGGKGVEKVKGEEKRKRHKKKGYKRESKDYIKKLAYMAKVYKKHKSDVEKHLGKDDKDVFKRLEKIAKPEGKEEPTVVDMMKKLKKKDKESKEVFDKLTKVVDKHKKKKVFKKF